MAYPYYQRAGSGWGTSQVCTPFPLRTILTVFSVPQYQFGPPPVPEFQPQPGCKSSITLMCNPWHFRYSKGVGSIISELMLTVPIRKHTFHLPCDWLSCAVPQSHCPNCNSSTWPSFRLNYVLWSVNPTIIILTIHNMVDHSITMPIPVFVNTLVMAVDSVLVWVYMKQKYGIEGPMVDLSVFSCYCCLLWTH